LPVKLYDPQFDHERIAPTQPRPDAPDDSYRSPIRKDYGRLIHSAAFRRLQGKTQLFPSHEDDFFRNRLTHSIEVAQIAKSIATKLNYQHDFFKADPIDVDIVEVASLCHDLGHPPFGHTGEEALDHQMKDKGGFEGNAQTFRILARLEKKLTLKSDGQGAPTPYEAGKDLRCGLNLTARVLASVLKYDAEIPQLDKERGDKIGKVFKGYYGADKEIVEFTKSKVLRGVDYTGSFKTIECSIMDIADDIAYSTYDLEDSFKAGFINPLDMFASPPALLDSVASKVNEKIQEAYTPDEIKAALNGLKFTSTHVRSVFATLFKTLFKSKAALEHLKNTDLEDNVKIALISKEVATASRNVISNGYIRTDLTSEFVGGFIEGVKVIPDDKLPPMLWNAKLDILTFAKIETLKKYNFEAQILSSRLKVPEHRGKEIVTTIFKKIADNEAALLPDDCRNLYEHAKGHDKDRIVCDFVAGMTDRYAVEFYNRLVGSTPVTIYKPL